jgi:Zn finger protein HypA/HybF involved in hydrogenase expression
MSNPLNPNLEAVLKALEQNKKEIEAKMTETLLLMENKRTSGKDEHEHKHWAAADVLEKDCPGCKSQVDIIKNLGRADLIKTLKERGDKRFECKDCGTGVDEKEEECPTCHGKKGRKRE